MADRKASTADLDQRDHQASNAPAAPEWSIPFTGPEMKALGLPGDDARQVRFHGEAVEHWPSFGGPDPDYQLPASHPAVAVALKNRERVEAGERPLCYWPGGEKAPEDYGGVVMFGNGHIDRTNAPWAWGRDGDPKGRCLVIAYLPRAEEPAEQEDAVQPSDEAKIETYDMCHEVAVELGYPSLTEALEHLDELKSADKVLLDKMTEAEWGKVYASGIRAWAKSVGIIKPDPVEELLAEFRRVHDAAHHGTARAAIAWMLEREGRKDG